MALRAGTRLGPYEIISPLGGGGMGEVYRARDTRLGRDVAVKILPSSLADSAAARQRFEREARAVSSLNHPNICALYDVGNQDGVEYLVMECLEGETLADRLTRGPLPLDELLRIGSQIAGALHVAHQRGVIHRDLRPGNIMLTNSGAKLMDFGLAKPTGPGSGVTELSSSPTVSKPLTAEGSIVGTFQYMAPEQLEHGPVDARTDVFAFGLVLYEMATGKRTFEGRTQASLIAAILKEEPRPLAEVAPMTPPALDRIVRTCLAKDPDARWHSARDVQIQLNWLRDRHADDAATLPAAPASRTRERLAWAAAAVLLLVAVVLGANQFRRTEPAAEPVRSAIAPPLGMTFVQDQFALSPDGTRLAFIAVSAGGQNTLWVRSLSAPRAQQLGGTDGAALPFWSPDSRRIGFYASGKLKIIDLSTGAVRELCDALLGRGGTWSRDDTIVFSQTIAGPLFRISANGGEPVQVTRVAESGGGVSHRWPHFLPDGKHFLYFSDWSAPGSPYPNGIYIGSVDSGEPRLLFSDITGNVVYSSGHLLYVRDRRLMAHPFDVNKLQPTAAPLPVGEQELEKDLAFYHAGFSVSENGMLVFQSAADSPSRFIWFDAKGNELGQLPAERLRDPRISPDGRFVAAASDDVGNGKRLIRVFDLGRGVSTRLTDGGNEVMPVWSRDSKQITYVSEEVNRFSIAELPADASGSSKVVLQGPRMIPTDRTADGGLIYMSFEKGPSNLMIRSPSGQTSPVMGQVTAAEGQVSPDGKWLAFVASPFNEVMIQPFLAPGPRIQISSGGGGQARWSRDGRQLFYIARDKKMMAVSFDPQKRTAGVPRVLFQTRIVSAQFVLFQFDVAPDGRFLINSFPSDHSSPLTLVTNWPELLKR